MSTEPASWPTVTVTPFVTDDRVIWRDGKPRCAKHRGVCLVRAQAVGIDSPGHVCAVCMRESRS